MTPEAEIQEQCIQLLTRAGWLVLRLNSGRTSRGIAWVRWYNGSCHDAGASDLVALKDGRLLMLEIKRPGGKPTDGQLKFLRCAQEHGAGAIIISDVAELEEFLR